MSWSIVITSRTWGTHERICSRLMGAFYYGYFVEHLYVASAHSSILVFTESGRVHRLKVWQVPELGPVVPTRSRDLIREATGRQASAQVLKVSPLGPVVAKNEGTLFARKQLLESAWRIPKVPTFRIPEKLSLRSVSANPESVNFPRPNFPYCLLQRSTCI